MSNAVTDMAGTFTRWHTWFLMGNQDIQMRYRRSVIGPFWISGSLGALVLSLALVYGQIFEQPFEEYLHWLISGFAVWYLFSTMVIEGCNIAVEAESQLRNVPLPIPVLAARMVYRNWIVFLHNLVVVAVVLIVFAIPPTWALLWALPGVAIVLATGFFASIALGPICLRFRDLNQVITNLLQMAFFLTPILWMPSQGRVASNFVLYNPVYHMLEVVRAPLMGGEPAQLSWIFALSTLGVVALFAIVTLQVTRNRVFLWL